MYKKQKFVISIHLLQIASLNIPRLLLAWALILMATGPLIEPRSTMISIFVMISLIVRSLRYTYQILVLVFDTLKDSYHRLGISDQVLPKHILTNMALSSIGWILCVVLLLTILLRDRPWARSILPYYSISVQWSNCLLLIWNRWCDLIGSDQLILIGSFETVY